MSERLNTQDLIEILIERQGLDKKQAESFIKEFFALIEEGLERDKSVKIKGLGTFKLVDVESRESVNVNTGERIEIQGHTKISFTPDAVLRDVINKPFAHFETVVLNDDVTFNELIEDKEDKDEEENLSEIIEIIEEKEEVPTIPLNTEENELKETPTPIHEEKKDEESEESNIPESIKETKIVEAPPTPEKKAEKNSSNNKVLIIVVVLTTLLCGVLLFFTYYSDIFPEKRKQSPTVVPKDNAIDESTTTDSTTVAAIDSTKQTHITPKTNAEKPAKTSISTETVRSNVIPFSQIPVNADSTSYEIVGTMASHTIEDGQTLIRLSYRYYKTKDLWPYLVMHNRSVIKDPNRVPIGTTINIPKLKKK